MDSLSEVSPGLIATVIVLCLSGGVAHYIDHFRDSKRKYNPVIEFIGDCVYSIVAGGSAWLLSISMGANEFLSAAMAVVFGHMGARFIWLVQRKLLSKFGP